MNIQSTRTFSSIPTTVAEFVPPTYRMRLWWWGVAMLIVVLTWPTLTQLTGDLGYLAARQMYVAGHTERALWLLPHVARLQQEPSPARNLAGYILYTVDEREKSEQQLRMGEMQDRRRAEGSAEDGAQNGVDGSLFNNLAVLRHAQEDVEEALLLQQQAATAAVDTAIPHYNLGIMLWQQGDQVAARRALREATYIEPAWAPPHAFLALIALWEEDYAAAESYAETAVALAPDYALGYDIYMQALLAQRKGLPLLAILDRAEGYITDHDRLALYRALAMEAIGERDGAKHLLETLFLRTTDQAIRHRVMVELRAITQP